MVRYLFDSHGNYIAFLVEDRLYSATTDLHIGRYYPDVNAFSDLVGVYLGEIVDGNRLVYNKFSPSLLTNFGSLVHQGSYSHYSALPILGMDLPYLHRDLDPTNLR